MTNIPIPPPHETFVDPNTGQVNEIWYRYLTEGNTSLNKTRRTVLTANTTYYVRTDGNDNTGDGSANDAAHAFATPQVCFNYIRNNIDAGGYYVKIKLAAGTYSQVTTTVSNSDSGSTQTAVLYIDSPIPGAAALIIEGDTTTPTNVIFSGTGILINNGSGGIYRINGLKFQSDGTSGQQAFFCFGSGCDISFGNTNFGAFTGAGTASNHLHVYGPNVLKLFSSYTISGGAGQHIWLEGEASLDWESSTVTLSGTPAFTSFIVVEQQSHALVIAVVFSGGATGVRYQDNDGVIATANPVQSNLNSYFPGDTNGTPTSYRYSEGNWTPTLLFNGASTGVVYTTQVGRYIKHYNHVTLWARIALSSNGSATGSAQLSGIPYNSVSTAGYRAVGSFGQYSNIVSDNHGYHCGLQNSDTRIDLLKWGGAGVNASAFLTDTEISDTADFTITLVYETS